jgi:hypothetical protein
VLHAILVSLASSILGALVIVGCTFVLLKIFAPDVFQEGAIAIPEVPISQEYADFQDLVTKHTLAWRATGFSKTQATIRGRISVGHLDNYVRLYKIKHSALSSLNPDMMAVSQTALAGGISGYFIFESKQSEQETPEQKAPEQKAPEQQTANSTPGFVQ